MKKFVKNLYKKPKTERLVEFVSNERLSNMAENPGCILYAREMDSQRH